MLPGPYERDSGVQKPITADDFKWILHAAVQQR